jgi:two-component system response regulator AtoC
LRERPEDIAELARFFIDRHATRMGLTARGISSSAMRLLTEHSWPGNVRELEHAIERALVVTGGAAIEPSDLPATVRPNGGNASVIDGGLSVKRQTTELEKTLIRRALEQTRGNRTRAARLLEISHRALLYKIREYGLE